MQTLSPKNRFAAEEKNVIGKSKQRLIARKTFYRLPVPRLITLAKTYMRTGVAWPIFWVSGSGDERIYDTIFGVGIVWNSIL